MSQRFVTREDVVDIATYEKNRPEFRTRVMDEKGRRRVRVGEHFNFLFENHLTVLYQVQEMMRTERIVEEAAIAHEMKTYNELIPAQGWLSATLLIEYEDRPQREANLPKLLGVNDHVWLVVGDLPPVKGVFNGSQIGETRISSVQYLHFPLEGPHRAKWSEAAEAGTLLLKVDHPHYTHQTALSSDVAQALREDFS